MTKMRESGVEWLGPIPEHWQVRRGKSLCHIGTGSSDTQDAVDNGYPFYIRSPKPLAYPTYEFDCEAILTAGDGAVGEVFHHVVGKFAAHQRVYVLRNFRPEVDARFFFYFFSRYFKRMAGDGSAKTTVDSVRRHMLTDMPFALPPLAEQRAIATYLDRETAEIDALVAAQSGLIATLRERRAAIVEDAVFPEGGESIRLKHAFKRIKDIEHPEEQMLSVFRDLGVVRKDDHPNLNVTAENRNIYQLIHPGWLAVNRMKAWQGSVGVSSYRGIVSGHYICFRPLLRQHDAFMNYLLRSRPFTEQYAAISRGVRPGQAEIDNDKLQDLRLPVPPFDEQRRIADYLDEKTAEIDALIAETERFIALAKERRAALITAAVTGQIDCTHLIESEAS